MANENALIYAHASDNAALVATWSVETGTIEAGYSPSYIADKNPAKPAKLQETTGAFLATFAGAQRVDWVLLPMHNLDAGLEVRIQGNATNTWGSPTLNTTIVIPTYREDGFPVACWKDLTGVTGYSTGGFQYWRLVVVGTNTNPVRIGEVALFSRKRTLDPNISWGTNEDEERKIVEQRTDYGVSNIYDLGTTGRTWVGDLDSPDLQRAALRTWWRDARGRSLPFGIVPDGTLNEAAFVRFMDTKLAVQLANFDRNNIRVGFEEVSRGLVL